MIDIFGSAFDKETFTSFVVDFLPDFERDERPVNTTGILKKVNQIGKSNACNLSVFEITIDETDAEKRIAITQNAFRMLRRHRIRNALIAFHYQSDNWRLSLLTSTLEIKDGKIVSKSSNPRRYSYLLGADAKANTPRKFLMKQGRVSGIKELQGRFSVDVVNKEFYNSVAECFMELVGGERGEGRKSQKFVAALQLPSLDKKEMQEFSVRLIGRIMFCWFLKEKKSPNGEPLMPSELLSLDAVSKNSDYYHNVLEPLFFGCLNTRISKRVDDLREEPFNQIPYLNGGLFSPQSTDYYNQNDFNGRGTPGLVKIPDEWFTRLFNVLNQYNFTVDENTSFDIDLSIDPEMLGRIFENLLAEINPETGKTARNATGSFYTPREIVDYMVDSSIFEYLRNKTNVEAKKLTALISYGKEDDEESPLTDAERSAVVNAIADLTILDPACGSGAFPIGILQKVFYILQQVDPDGRKWYEKQIENIPSEELKKDLKNKFESGNYDYIRKLGVIRQSIFGVDIQTIATEIAKLRCFLTLIIEEQVDDSKENRGIHPLPNLDFKFVAANSLVELPGNHEAAINMFDGLDQIHALKRIRNEYFTADENERMLLRARFAELQNDMFKQRINLHGATSDKYNALTEWKPFDNNMVDWFDSEWMFGVKLFDIVIGNPPYVVLTAKADHVGFYKKEYFVAKSGKINLFKLFFERGLSVLKEDGALSYITPNTYLSSKDGVNTRILLLENTIKEIIEYTEKDQVFENVAQAVATIVLQKTRTDGSNTVSIKTAKQGLRKISQKSFNANKNCMFIPMNTVIRHMIKHKKTLSSLADVYQGEINLTFKKKSYSNERRIGALPMWRGDNVGKFEPTSNPTDYCDVSADDREHRRRRRIVMQQVSNQNQPFRTKAFISPTNYLCGNSTNYVIPRDDADMEFLLGVINSEAFNYFFDYFSFTNHLTVNELMDMPLPETNQESRQKITQVVEKILSAKGNKAKLMELDGELNAKVYDLYGLDNDDISVINARKMSFN